MGIHYSTLSAYQRKVLIKNQLKARLKQAQRPYIPPTVKNDLIPLSTAQNRFWHFQQLHPDNPVTNRPIALSLTGPLNRIALQQALDALVQRHEILRTTYQDRAGTPVQRILPPSPMPIEFKDMRRCANPEGETHRLAVQAAQQIIDLQHGPIIHAIVCQIAAEAHQLLLLLPHIACDAWSVGIVIQELAMLYETFSQARGISPLETKIQYADFSVWQAQFLKSDEAKKQLNYWTNQLKGLYPSVWPKDYTPSYQQQGQSQRATLLFPKSLATSLENLGRSEQATFFMVLLAAFQILQGRYTAQTDVSVGTLIAGRTRAEFNSLIGCFINTLILRTDLSGGNEATKPPTFRELLRQIRQTTLAAYRNQEIPYEQVLESLQHNRPQHPLFPVLFQFRNQPTAKIQTHELAIKPDLINFGIGGQELGVELTNTAEGLQCVIEYAPHLFRSDTIMRLAGHYQSLLEAISTNPDQPITMLPLLTAEEEKTLLIEWNATQVTYPKGQAIHQLFEAHVAKTPYATALIYGEQKLTYATLNERANQLAFYLQQKGVGPEVIVGICLERSVEMIVSLLAILKAGGAYLPLSPTIPQERLAFILDDAQIQYLITQDIFTDRFLKPGLCLISVDSTGEIDSLSKQNPNAAISPEALAYVIYTSGSTGKPKGVQIEHRGIGNMVLAQIETFAIKPTSHILQFASLTFDASVSEIFMAFLAGATLVIPTEDTLLTGDVLHHFLRDAAITTATIPPSILAGLSEEDLPALQTVITAGEACSAEIAARWQKNRRFFNAYGPTEGTVCATIAEVNQTPWEPTIGRPIANTQAYILDEAQCPVPIGVAGELYISGLGLARGYLNQPALTAETFIPHPFEANSTSRLYKTGDQARYRPDGTIEFLGRRDDQVKIRGFRIELAEIALTLKQHPNVQDCAIIVQDDDPNDKRILAYLVLKEANKPLTDTHLRHFLLEKLPPYMTPTTFITLDSLPINSSGKIDRQALPRPDATRPNLDQAFAPPRTCAESQLAQIWQDILNVDRIGVFDNFFELGGHSLLLTQLASRIRDTFHVQLPLRLLFDLTTIDQMILAILERQVGITQAAKVDQMLDKLNQLSGDEILHLLDATS